MKVFVLMLFGVLSAACTADNTVPAVSAGSIVRHTLSSTQIGERNVDVWLPTGYPQQAPYAVLYMHDGQMLFDGRTTWNKQEWRVDEVASELMAKHAVRPFIVVGIWNAGTARAPEYFPQKAFETLPRDVQIALYDYYAKRINAASVPVYSNRYLRFLVNELKPFVDRQYAVDSKRDSTFVAGSSMGGLISMYALAEYPDVFGGAACLSTHWPGFADKRDNNRVPDAMIAYVERHFPASGQHTVYFDYGTEMLDALYAEHQLRVDEVLRRKGYSAKDWQSREFKGADHSEQAWSARLHVPLRFLLGSPTP